MIITWQLRPEWCCETLEVFWCVRNVHGSIFKTYFKNVFLLIFTKYICSLKRKKMCVDAELEPGGVGSRCEWASHRDFVQTFSTSKDALNCICQRLATRVSWHFRWHKSQMNSNITGVTLPNKRKKTCVVLTVMIKKRNRSESHTSQIKKVRCGPRLPAEWT